MLLEVLRVKELYYYLATVYVINSDSHWFTLVILTAIGLRW